MMNENHITIQQLALYLNCECMASGKKGRLVKVDAEHLPSISFHGANGISNRQLISPDKIKPMLIPLSEVNLEHLQAIAKKHEYDEKYIRRFIDIVSLGDVGTKADFVSHEEDFRTAVWILNELRALGYDCDDLIEQGLAIDKTKEE